MEASLAERRARVFLQYHFPSFFLFLSIFFFLFLLYIPHTHFSFLVGDPGPVQGFGDKEFIASFWRGGRRIFGSFSFFLSLRVSLLGVWCGFDKLLDSERV